MEAPLSGSSDAPVSYRDPDRELSERERVSDHLQTLLDALPAAVIVVDGEGRVQECNTAAAELLGSGLEGRLWRDLVPLLFEFQGTGDDLQLKNGRLVSLETRPLGRQPGQILLLNDVTEKRHLQQSLHRQQRLVDMGRMAASLAHQIRTPLSSAILYLSKMVGGELSEAQQQRFSAKALGRLQDLDQLINDMLLFARGDKGSAEPIEPRALLIGAIDPIRERLEEQGIRWQVRDDSHGLLLYGNSTLLTSALQNLINNSRQVVDGEGEIELIAERVDDSRLKLVVSDNGPGIPYEQQRRIFEPFISGRSSGTGLGLAVVQAVVRSHRGEINVDSAPGKGCRIIIELPALTRERLGALKAVTDETGA